MGVQASQTFSSTGPHGHRGRMRTRLLAGPDGLADYELLEMLLFLGIPRRDTKPLAKSLINQFGSLAATLAAPSAALRRAGVPERAVEALELVAEATGHLAAAERIERPVLNDWAALDAYLGVPARSEGPAQLAVLFLNNRNQLLAEEAWAPQTEPAALARDALRRALDLHATALIVVRTRPADSPEPQASDLAISRAVTRAAEMLSVLLHDVLIVGRGDWVSLRQQGLL